MTQSRPHRWPLRARIAAAGAITCGVATLFSAVRVVRVEGTSDIHVHIDITLLELTLLAAGIVLLVLALRLRVNPALKAEL